MLRIAVTDVHGRAPFVRHIGQMLGRCDFLFQVTDDLTAVRCRYKPQGKAVGYNRRIKLQLFAVCKMQFSHVRRLPFIR